MAKRFVVPFITTVLVLIAVVTTERHFQVWSNMGFLMSSEMEGPPTLSHWERVAQQHPNDWQAQHAWADLTGNAKESVARYDKIIVRFPDKAALYAGRTVRYAQIVSFGRPEGSWLTGQEAPKNMPKPNVPDLERAVVAAREGMKVEPDNAFYNYALAGYLFGLRRDEEALAQMAEGTRKPRYDSHVRDVGLSRIRLDELAHGTPMSKVALAAMTLLPHCAQEREMARIVLWFGKEAEKKGNHALALERYGYVLRMGEHLMDGASLLIEGLVGAAIEAIGIKRGGKFNIPRGLSGDEQQKWSNRMMRKATQEFADYAAAHGRADLVSAAWTGLKKAQTAKDLAQYFVGRDRRHFRNVEEPYAALADYLRVVVGQAGLIGQALIALLLAGVTALLARKFREKQQVSWLTAFCVALICWLPAAVLLYTTCKRVPNVFGGESTAGAFSPLLWGVAVFLPFVLEDLCWGVRNVYLRLRRGAWRFDSPPLLPRTCVMLALLSLFTYVVLLVPLRYTENKANAYVKKVAAGEMQLAREAMTKAKK